MHFLQSRSKQTSGLDCGCLPPPLAKRQAGPRPTQSDAAKSPRRLRRGRCRDFCRWRTRLPLTSADGIPSPLAAPPPRAAATSGDPNPNPYSLPSRAEPPGAAAAAAEATAAARSPLPPARDAFTANASAQRSGGLPRPLPPPPGA